jgi:hypothetical protein
MVRTLVVQKAVAQQLKRPRAQQVRVLPLDRAPHAYALPFLSARLVFV